MSYRSYRRRSGDDSVGGYLGYVFRWFFLGIVIGVILLIVLLVASSSSASAGRVFPFTMADCLHAGVSAKLCRHRHPKPGPNCEKYAREWSFSTSKMDHICHPREYGPYEPHQYVSPADRCVKRMILNGHDGNWIYRYCGAAPFS